MAQIINTNIPSLSAQRNLNRSQSALNTSLQRLSSGLRINSAKDDAAGLAIAERFSSQIRGLNQAIRNANDGVSMAQTAEGALSEVGNVLQRVRELAVQSANATNSGTDRQALQAEVNQLVSELDRIATTTDFNGKKLLDGTSSTNDFQVGADAFQTITATTKNFRTSQYGVNRVGGVATSAVDAAGTHRVQTADTLTVNGAIGSADITINAGDSAKDVAASVNSSTDATGVEANARTQTDLTLSAAGNYVLSMESNNIGDAVTISFAVSAATGSDGLSAAVEAINEKASQTGVTAAVNDDESGITLTNATGEDIIVSETGAGAADNSGDITVAGQAISAAAGTDSVVVVGQVTFDSDKSYSLQTGAAGEIITNASETSTLQSVSSLDVSSVDNANLALAIVDAALSAVSNQRAKFGALQSRFESSIANLEVTAENLSSARSRIQDADFASETAALTRAQILQQAGTAMLSQANALPQNVLALLQ